MELDDPICYGGFGTTYTTTLADLLLLQSAFASSHQDIVLFFIMLKPLGEVCTVHCLYALYSLACVFIRKMPVPGFSTRLTTCCLLEW